MTPQTNFSQMRSSHQTNSLVTPRCKLSPVPGRRRISPGHLFNHPGSLSDIRIRSIFQHQNVVKEHVKSSNIFSSEIFLSIPSHIKSFPFHWGKFYNLKVGREMMFPSPSEEIKAWGSRENLHVKPPQPLRHLPLLGRAHSYQLSSRTPTSVPNTKESHS